MHAERDLIIAIAASRDDKSQMVENTFAEAMHEREPVCGGEINSRLPLFGAALRSAWRNPDLH
jgi:hypothetical protein